MVDAFIAAHTAAPRSDARHYVIHGTFAAPDSLAKLAAHGYGISMNPTIMWTTAEPMDGIMGPEVSARQ